MLLKSVNVEKVADGVFAVKQLFEAVREVSVPLYDRSEGGAFVDSGRRQKLMQTVGEWQERVFPTEEEAEAFAEQARASLL